jgi:hypothetical protein
MDVGNLDYLISRGGSKFTRWKLFLLLVLVCLPLLATGCLCLNFGDCDRPEVDGVLTQKGEVTCAFGKPGTPMTVYYPVPYASPPNLEIHDHFKRYIILEQRADCFRIVQDMPGLPVEWTARGVRAPSLTTVGPAVQAPVFPGPNIPPEPLPVAPTIPGQ